jgi:hypothetical protein
MENIYFFYLLKRIYVFNNEYFLLLVFINSKWEACIV